MSNVNKNGTVQVTLELVPARGCLGCVFYDVECNRVPSLPDCEGVIFKFKLENDDAN